MCLRTSGAILGNQRPLVCIDALELDILRSPARSVSFRGFV